MSRARILQRIRLATPSPAAETELPDPPDFPTYPDPVAQFAAELEAAGGHFLDGRGGAIVDCLRRVVVESQNRTICWESAQALERHGLPYQLRGRHGFQPGALVFSDHLNDEVSLPLILFSRKSRRSRSDEVTLVASHGDGALAETGSVLVTVKPGLERALPFLAPTQLLLVAEGSIHHNMQQLMDHFEPGLEESLATLVTGPSRTADIEKTLVTGVHGPRQVFVIVTDGAESAS